VPRQKNIEVRRKVLALWNQGIHSPSEIARRLGLPPGRVRFLIYQMRKEGLLPKINPIGDLLDETLDVIKAALFRVTAVHAELLTRSDPKARALAEAQDMLQRAIENIVVYKKMKQIEGDRRA